MTNRDEFFYPHSRYYGDIKPENLVFNANLQQFAQQVNYICNLETAGKVEPEAAYKQIKDLWHRLRRSKQELAVGQHPFHRDDRGK
ncbi:DUF7219 family protein [Coleofasciculus sp. G2-EDA-02]|uniref:DUF7219 family protein n=1 Tax=Coleofasciculus sp. G2-EDA-02 TaxID=3069529 RepID=UPI0032FFB3A8